MKFSSRTIQLLKNFSTINPAIILKEGNILSTIDPNKTMLAKAEVDETFPKECAIHNLSTFLATMSLLKDPDIQFNNDHLSIVEGPTAVKIRYGNPSLIATPPSKSLTTTEEVKFKLFSQTFQSVMKAQGALQLPEIAVQGNDQGIFFSAIDSKNVSGDSFSMKVNGPNGHEFCFVFNPNNLKLISDNYDVTISQKGLMYLKGERLEYWVPVETNSNFK